MFEILPAWFFYTFLFFLGAIIGSFLNVVIYRFHTGKSINGQSHCLSCLQPLWWYELFPLLSYLVLKGRCRSCLSHIPPRYFVVELLTALAFTSLYCLSDSVGEMFMLGILFSVLIVVAVYDIYHLIIPNEFVFALSAIALLWQGMAAYEAFSLAELINPALSALGAFAFFGGLWKVSGGRWIGFGDAKLVVPLAFIAGFPAVFSLVILSFWVGAAVSVLWLLVQKITERGKVPLRFLGQNITMKSEIPFAPFLIVGFLLSVFCEIKVMSLVAYVF